VGYRNQSIDQTYLGTDALFRYRLPIGAVAPYAEAGVSGTWSLESDVPQVGYTEGVRSGTGFRDGFRDIFELGYTVGAGVIVEPISVGARRRARTSVLAELTVVSYEVIVGYRF
jgi:opacity protein-like surface antigen